MLLESHTSMMVGACCSSSFVTDHQAGHTLCSAAFFFFFFLYFAQWKTLQSIQGSCQLHRLQQLGLVLQLLLQGQSYLVALQEFSLPLSEGVCSTSIQSSETKLFVSRQRTARVVFVVITWIPAILSLGLLLGADLAWPDPSTDRSLWLGRSKYSAPAPCRCVHHCARTSLSGWFLTKPNPFASAPLPQGSSFSYYSSGFARPGEACLPVPDTCVLSKELGG